MRPALKAATTTTGSSPQFHFIGGKGGVGKTTCAAAFAVIGARAGLRVLVASTDPAPSLGDALNTRLSGSPKPVEAAFRRPGTRRPGTLHAVEIDAAAVLHRWIAERRAALEKIALEGTWLDREDVGKLLNLSLPGIDEVAALLELARLARTGRYDRIVVDTAPTGHTLRMLAMPETLFAVARVFDRMREKHRMIVEALRGRSVEAPEDVLIADLAREARELRAMLTDGERTRVSWVTLPEPMAVAETIDALQRLADRAAPVNEIIVNRLTPPPSPVILRSLQCAAGLRGESRARASGDGTRIRARTRPRAQGCDGAVCYRAGSSEAQCSASIAPCFASPGQLTHAGPGVEPESIATAGTRLVMFGGKGGVGKTTCAAAAAIAAANRWPATKILLISTDPAHSLADVLNTKVGDRAGRVTGAPPNLLVREMDAGRVFDAVRVKYAAAVDDLFDRLTGKGAFDVGHDRSVMHGLMDLAPPGLDELAAIVEITAEVSRTGDHLTIIDTAPTGHALRLLEMPALIHGWIKALMAILLKYQPVIGLGELGTTLVDLSKGLGRLRELLSDNTRTHFVVVTRAAALPRAESERLLRRLHRLGVDVPMVITNAVGRGTCTRCAKASAAERREIGALERIVNTSRKPRALIVTAARIPPPHSPASLRAWQRSGWRYHQDA